ncbi:lipid-A-disaccharide synthase [Stella humosa]|uniref:Lipid-A-disaccharide synthase n=1 Tax=Stella humosa TaxID=94 RepID=A0A3N1MDM4_9PROT|nr:lipid-A-disaccharide synthase [Stella humosa]ROQ01648.1 lipid-A-disaccharide synthase [Stella humosa]BBK32029.1 lipid-A-disaccharide synthase [Stella humosa]
MTEPVPTIFLVAAEPSGDAIGGRLMAALSRRLDGRVAFDGIGGERMAAAGLASRVPLSALSLFGVFEVLPQALRILRLVRDTAAAIVAARPAAVVTIDSSGFNFRLARQLRQQGYKGPLIHYVAPQLWAWWRPAKARSLRRWYDRVLALFPFEPEFFRGHGIECRFVGHPAIEEGFGRAPDPTFRARYGIAADAPVLAVLPGSRGSEIKRLLPIFAVAVAELGRRIPGLHVVLPTVPTVADRVEQAVAGWPLPVAIVRAPGDKPAAFAASDAALAASGTVTLELALSGTPFVVGYSVNAATAWLVRRKVRVRYATMVNLLMDRAIAPELLQDDCTPTALVSALLPLLTDPTARAAQRRDLATAIGLLGGGEEAPSERAAAAILELVSAPRS